jgi:hypothetical protein
MSEIAIATRSPFSSAPHQPHRCQAIAEPGLSQGEAACGWWAIAKTSVGDHSSKAMLMLQAIAQLSRGTGERVISEKLAGAIAPAAIC